MKRLRPELPVEAAVLHSFGNVLGADVFGERKGTSYIAPVKTQIKKPQIIEFSPVY